MKTWGSWPLGSDVGETGGKFTVILAWHELGEMFGKQFWEAILGIPVGVGYSSMSNFGQIMCSFVGSEG